MSPTPTPARIALPPHHTGVAILGCGTIAHSAHLPAYQQHGIGVTGVWSRSPHTTADTRTRFPFVGKVYGSAEDLLADPEVRIVDIATGPQGRLRWLEAAIEAGKHVLAQKPLVADAEDLQRLPVILDRADAAGLRVAVNHNARWAPPFRQATLMLRQGAVGDVVGVTHLHDKALPPLVGTPFDDVEHMLVTDYLLHWLDITRTWLSLAPSGGAPSRDMTVSAVESRVPGQPEAARNPWSATITLADRSSGATAGIRIAGSATTTNPGCPFWIHGTSGTLRGSVLLGSDRLSVDDGTTVTDIPLTGAWFVDGFAAAMAELMWAIDDNREPENSARDAMQSIQLMLAAAESASAGGTPVTVHLSGGAA